MSWSGPAFTNVKIPQVESRITYKDQIMMIGSCFTEHISSKLLRFKYNVDVNPFGILYNPHSIAECVRRIVEHNTYLAEDLILHDGLYHSPDHHGSFSDLKLEQTLKRINTRIFDAHTLIENVNYVFISPGTSKVYRLKSSGQIVGNCHKIPQNDFDTDFLDIDACVLAFEKIYSLIRSKSPHAKFIWTISPVRHIKEGLIQNQKSKANLILSMDRFMAGKTNCYYFPAYEIMIDQLRDYRYYASDLVHPSGEAAEIIWTIFRDHYLDTDEVKLHMEIEKIKLAVEHRFLHPRPEQISSFANSILSQIDRVEKLRPGLNWKEEKIYLTSLI